MEKGVVLADPEAADHASELHLCTCKSAQCVHCCLHEALRAQDTEYDSTALDIGACDGDLNDDSQQYPSPHTQSMKLVAADGTRQMQAGGAAVRKLKLPCRRNSRSSFPPSSQEKLSKSAWPPLPLPVPPSADDSMVYSNARVDPHTLYLSSHKKVDLSMLSVTSSSFEHEQEITSSHQLFEQQFNSIEKSTKLMSSNGNPRRICRYCDREFPSGRALGGHMRVHGGLDADRVPSVINMKLEHAQFNSSMTRSSSPMLNSTSEPQFTEVNCMVSGSSPLNYSSGGVIKRRINSEESLVRGPEGKKLGLISGRHASREPIIYNVTEERPLRRKEQLVQGMKEDQLAIEKGISSQAQKLLCLTKKDLDQRERVNNVDSYDDDDDNDGSSHLLSSKLHIIMGKGNEQTKPLIAKQSNTVNSVSECNVDEGSLLQKLRPNPRPSRRRLWTDQEGASVTSKKESSTSPPQDLGGQLQPSSLAPSLQAAQERTGLGAERGCSCSECGKVFWSWKALFGHMRCHPEREWRGIQRPVDASSSELEKQTRATRGLSSLSVASAGAEKPETEPESDAENREVAETNQAPCNTSASAKEETIGMKDRFHEAELINGTIDDIKEEEGLMSPKRVLKGKFSHDTADDDDLTPAWPTRKRSKRSRASMGATLRVSSVTSTEPALTSDTATSSELKENDKVGIRDQEDLDMANCLVLLSSAGNKVQERVMKCPGFGSAEESTIYKRRRVVDQYHQQVNVVSSNGIVGDDDGGDETEAENEEVLATSKFNAGGGVKYECSTCKRCFKSHQALGGHRASHRKTKGCFALMNENAEESMQEGKEDNNAESEDFNSSELNQWQAMGHGLSLHNQRDERKAQNHSNVSPSTTDHQLPTGPSKKKKFKGHACSICHRIFPSGQALGGHKRCHWTGEKIAESGSMASSSNNKGFLQEHDEWGVGSGDASPPNTRRAKRSKEDGIDLNLPAPLDEDDDEGRYDNAGLSSNEVIEQDVQDGVEDADLDVEEVNEGYLVDYIGGKKRSVNKLVSEWDASTEAELRGRHGGATAAVETSVGGDRGAKRRSDKRTSTGGSMWDLQWTNGASSSSAGPPNPQVCAVQRL